MAEKITENSEKEVTETAKVEKTEETKDKQKEETKTEEVEEPIVESEVVKNTSVIPRKQTETKKQENALSVNLNFGHYQEFMEFCAVIAKDNKLSPLKTQTDVAIALLAGASLGLSIPVALNNIVPIKGRATLSNNLQMGLLATEGIIPEILNDAEPMYGVYFYDYDADGNIKEVTKDKGKATERKVKSVLEVKYKFRSECEQMLKDYESVKEMDGYSPIELITEKPKILWKPLGKGTRVRLTRQVRQPNGTYKESTITRTYTTMDADKILMLDSNTNTYKSVRQVKDSWINYEDDMLYANAFRRCCKIIAQDITMNLYSTEEMLDTTNINYTLEEEGTVSILDKDGKVVHKTVPNT